MPRLVLEIGTEEIPPRFFPVALPQLKADGEAMLARARLDCAEVKVYGAPRRLVFVAEKLAERQAPAVREERGPPARVAFDDDGKPTKAAAGFARRHGIAPEDLEKRTTDQGDYVFAIIQEAELPVADALAPLLPDLITGLSFPKSMRWGTESIRFGRPIRWLLALVDESVVEFSLGHLHSGRLTRGHPTLSDGMHPVAHADRYEETLRDNHVIVNQDERRHLICRLLDLVAGQQQARVVDGGLLDETAFLVEWPTAAFGSFDPEFLTLPRAVLVEEMQHVQSYFPLENESGDLLPRFIAVRDGGEDHLDAVLAGWQSVLKAKLIDASYFYQHDLKTPLADRVDALRGVVFQEQLGSMHDKVQRVRRVASALADQAGLSQADAVALDRAALLCKADLTTQMVAELSGLQGIIGGVYAGRSGEPDAVAAAIAEHYRPRGAGDEIPETSLGRLLAVADKIDTITALFAIGIVPTGSADPYGLRREATGIVSIALALGEPERAARITLSVPGLARAALDTLAQQVEMGRPPDEIVEQAMDFLRQRLATSLRDDGIRYDLVDAALAVGIDDIAAAARRARAIAMLAEREDFLPTVIACTRPINISKDFEGGDVDPSLFQEPAERELWDAYTRVVEQADGANPVVLFGLITSELKAPIDRYFDDVLVMAKDDDVRRNRLAVCWRLAQLFRRIADFSLVVQA